MVDNIFAAEHLGSTDCDRAAKCRALAAAAGALAIEATTPKSRGAYRDIQKEWLRLANEIERSRSKPQSEKESTAVADFLKRGGKVANFREPFR